MGKERESQPWITLPEWQFAERILNIVSGQNSPVKQWRGGLTTGEIVAFAQSPQGLKPVPSPLSVRMALAYLCLQGKIKRGWKEIPVHEISETIEGNLNKTRVWVRIELQ
jgi:hypothetical protein